MSTAELRIVYRPDDTWIGQVEAVVVSGAFSGKGSAWFDRQSLKEKFIADLRAFPLDAGHPPMLEGGYWSKDSPVTLRQCHLRITIRPFNIRGQLLVQVDLASEARTSDQQQCVTARFVTDYASLDQFASEFTQVLEGEREVAVLPGDAA